MMGIRLYKQSACSDLDRIRPLRDWLNRHTDFKRVRAWMSTWRCPLIFVFVLGISTDVFSAELTLNWADNSLNEIGFRVQRKQGAGDFITIATTVANDPSFTDRTVVEGEVYWYRVCAYNDYGSSDYATSGAIVIPGVPPGVGVSGPSIGLVDDRVMLPNQESETIGFSVADQVFPASDISLSATSSNLDLLPLDRITLGGIGNGRWIRATPVPGRTGMTLVTLTASNGRASSQRVFRITILGSTPPPPDDPAKPIAGTNSVAPGFYYGDVDAGGVAFSLWIGPDHSSVLALSGPQFVNGVAQTRFSVTESGDFSGHSSDLGAFSGNATNSSVTVSIGERALTLTGTLATSGRSTALLAGVYLGAVTAIADGEVTLLVSETGHAFMTARLDGVVHAALAIVQADGALTAVFPNGAIVSLRLNASTEQFEGTVAVAGRFLRAVGHRDNGSVSSNLVNLSVRSFLDDRSGSIIAGFTVGGNLDKPLLIRAVGPTLSAFGVTDAIADPALTIRRQGGSTSLPLAQNDNWQSTDSVTSVGANLGFPLLEGSRDASIGFTFPAGGYSVEVAGVADSNGTVLVELYDAETAAPSARSRLANLSVRTRVGTGSRVLVVGFVINGNAPKRLLLRAVGPELGTFGVPGALADPVLTLVRSDNGQNTEIFFCDDVAENGNSVAAIGAAVGAFPLNPLSKSAAGVVWLEPGVYSAVMKSATTVEGEGLIELYDVP